MVYIDTYRIYAHAPLPIAHFFDPGRQRWRRRRLRHMPTKNQIFRVHNCKVSAAGGIIVKRTRGSGMARANSRRPHRRFRFVSPNWPASRAGIGAFQSQCRIYYAKRCAAMSPMWAGARTHGRTLTDTDTHTTSHLSALTPSRLTS